MASLDLALKLKLSVRLLSQLSTAVSVSLSRSIKGKHHDPKFNELRRKKILEEFNGRFFVPLPDYRELREHIKKEDARLGLEKMKREGMLPPRDFNERPIDISSTFDIHQPYVPPEGDGSKSLISKDGAKQRGQHALMWTKTKNTVRKINKMEKDIGGFAPEYFSEEAVDIYVAAHEALQEDNRVRLHELVTTKCYKQLTNGLQYKTLRWRFHHNVEPPRLVYATLFKFGAGNDDFAQVTIRIHCQQSVAIYDRFGYLSYGARDDVRDVVEYVVFEKRLSDTYGTWRMHGKIEPNWTESKAPIRRTFRVPDHEKIDAEDLEKMDAKDLVDDEDDEESSKQKMDAKDLVDDEDDEESSKQPVAA